MRYRSCFLHEGRAYGTVRRSIGPVPTAHFLTCNLTPEGSITTRSQLRGAQAFVRRARPLTCYRDDDERKAYSTGRAPAARAFLKMEARQQLPFQDPSAPMPSACRVSIFDAQRMSLASREYVKKKMNVSQRRHELRDSTMNIRYVP